MLAALVLSIAFGLDCAFGLDARFIPNVPYHRQVNRCANLVGYVARLLISCSYACGAASSEMVLHFNGPDVWQSMAVV